MHRVAKLAHQLRHQSTRLESRALVFNKNGPVDKVLKVHHYPLPELSQNDVLLQILAAPINPADVNMIQGTYPVQPEFQSFGAIAGYEGVAQVMETGTQVQDIKKGDWVIPLNQSFGLSA